MTEESGELCGFDQAGFCRPDAFAEVVEPFAPASAEIKKAAQKASGEAWKIVIPELQNLDVEEEVKNAAVVLMKRLGGPKQPGMRRTKVIFWCAYEAHKRCGIEFDPEWLAKHFALGRKDISQALSMCDYTVTGIRSTHVDMDAAYFSRVYARAQGTIPVEAADGLAQLLQKQHPFDGELPQLVARGVIDFLSGEFKPTGHVKSDRVTGSVFHYLRSNFNRDGSKITQP